jgi:hypothetical protein
MSPSRSCSSVEGWYDPVPRCSGRRRAWANSIQCGMLVESQRIRDLLNTSFLLLTPAGARTHGRDEGFGAPKTYQIPLNPIPALIILLLGMMMSSHHQHSMLSSMIHRQWGTLLMGFSLVRGVTYLLLYISPPTSLLPSRPPTELISAFCLISGGLVFMASVSCPHPTFKLPTNSPLEQRHRLLDGNVQFERHVCFHLDHGLHRLPNGLGDHRPWY